jgi:hypothetical protein
MGSENGKNGKKTETEVDFFTGSAKKSLFPFPVFKK